ncbi:MAG TPA: hypothetical protein VNC50_17735, partial [Planctomycetia bacterium]|nr:hypothetical protein [Planctomycetia bacterium]
SNSHRREAQVASAAAAIPLDHLRAVRRNEGGDAHHPNERHRHGVRSLGSGDRDVTVCVR